MKILKRFEITYCGKLMATLTDFDMGFMAAIEGMNPEMVVTEIESGHSTKEAQELLNEILAGFYLDITEVMNDGKEVDILSSEGRHLIIMTWPKE